MSQVVAKRYAQALYEVAKVNDSVDEIQEQVSFISSVIEKHADLKLILGHPKISSEQKKGFLETVFGGYWSNTVRNFLELLIDRGRETEVNQISKAYQTIANEAKGVVHAHVTTATPLDDKEKTDLAKRLGKTLGQTLTIEGEVDSSIIGGLMVRIGNRLYDGSVKGKLTRFQQQLET